MMDVRQDLSVEELEAQEVVALPRRELLQAVACSAVSGGVVVQAVNIRSCNVGGDPLIDLLSTIGVGNLNAVVVAFP